MKEHLIENFGINEKTKSLNSINTYLRILLTFYFTMSSL